MEATGVGCYYSTMGAPHAWVNETLPVARQGLFSLKNALKRADDEGMVTLASGAKDGEK
jgi:hypothetical protein